MQNAVVKYSIIILFLLVYINRGLLISAALEVDNQEKGEINSVIELIIQLVTGEENGIDEDGDLQSNCNFVKVFQHDFLAQVGKSFEFVNIFKNKFIFPHKEDILGESFYGQIDHPPEIIGYF